MDYLIPTAMEIPEIEIHHIETPSTITANYRGVARADDRFAAGASQTPSRMRSPTSASTVTEQHLPPTRILELAGVIPTR